MSDLGIDRIGKRLLAFEAFQAGASAEIAASTNGVSLEELEDLLRIAMFTNIDDLACSIANGVGRTHPEDVELIATWLKGTLIFLAGPDVDLFAEARGAIIFPDR